jgi:hypothetical protein
VVLAKSAEVKQQWVARIQLARSRAASEQSLGETLGPERKMMARWLARQAYEETKEKKKEIA